jgi:hypothetical protein
MGVAGSRHRIRDLHRPDPLLPPAVMGANRPDRLHTDGDGE